MAWRHEMTTWQNRTWHDTIWIYNVTWHNMTIIHCTMIWNDKQGMTTLHDSTSICMPIYVCLKSRQIVPSAFPWFLLLSVCPDILGYRVLVNCGAISITLKYDTNWHTHTIIYMYFWINIITDLLHYVNAVYLETFVQFSFRRFAADPFLLMVEVISW